MLDLFDRGDVHDRGEGIVGRLAVVDVVVRMDRLLRANHTARELDSAIGDHLVGVHVGLRARAGLEDDKRELAVQLAVDHLLGSPRDQIDLVVGQLAQLFIRQRRALLQDAERADHGTSPPIPLDADGKILVGALGLSAPQVIRGYVDLAERVLLNPNVLRRAVRGAVWSRHREAPFGCRLADGTRLVYSGVYSCASTKARISFGLSTPSPCSPRSKTTLHTSTAVLTSVCKMLLCGGYTRPESSSDCVTWSATAWAATMNISSVTCLALVA